MFSCSGGNAGVWDIDDDGRSHDAPEPPRIASRHSGESRFMQAVVLDTSGTTFPHRRIASGVHACRAASLPWAPAPYGKQASPPANNASAQTNWKYACGYLSLE